LVDTGCEEKEGRRGGLYTDDEAIRSLGDILSRFLSDEEFVFMRCHSTGLKSGFAGPLCKEWGTLLLRLPLGTVVQTSAQKFSCAEIQLDWANGFLDVF
jgi:hypothetical protein